MAETEVLANAPRVDALIQEMAQQIRAMGDHQLALVGIHTGGVPLANRLADALEALGAPRPLLGETDITLYRDDLYTGLEKPSLGVTRLPFSVDGARVLLVDDVLFTGRTVRAAVDLLMDYGRPAWIRLAVLVDRGHRELPIAADIVGMRIETELADRVTVAFAETEGRPDEIAIQRRASPGA
ncbi:MAG: bifunctional pyr operon transcriptional regulator/uracil phosphoribosyltransferase PyrR [Myxococcota bacterium]|nr:bifunctional pyr operon transcriptional regulator/uracil phosphoribosyltransferase PyrR [Myxococcota bacterium]